MLLFPHLVNPVADRPRILVLDGPGLDAPPLHACLSGCDVVRASDFSDLIAHLRTDQFVAVLADPVRPGLREQVGRLAQSEMILDALGTGVVLIDDMRRIIWANSTFRAWCDGSTAGRDLFEALGNPHRSPSDLDPFDAALLPIPTPVRLQTDRNTFLELHLTPLPYGPDRPAAFVARFRDVTAEVERQQKLDALHQAGYALATLGEDQLAVMTVEQRVEWIKQNLRRTFHDLLHYDVIEVRLLDRQTGRLDPLLSDGMTEAAAGRELYAKTEGNGVTGFVAATGKSYLCPDTLNDPHFLPGAIGTKSSMTVPLLILGKVIGTFNVESPLPNAFDADDLQFTELFAREVARALRALELLSAQKYSAASQSVEAISGEIALPVDDILAATTELMSRYIGHDSEMCAGLLRIIDAARQIRQRIRKVGEDLGPAPTCAVAAGPPDPRLKGKRVLVMDADETVRRAAHELLDRHGMAVDTTGTAKQALVMASVTPYDAVLFEIKPPDMRGLETFRRLKEALPNSRLILMKGFDYDADHSYLDMRAEGLKHALFKPFNVNQLIDALGKPDAPPKIVPPPPAEIIQAS